MIKKENPIEITAHTIAFHENSTIFSLDVHKNILATTGFDKIIRLWNIKKADDLGIKENCYKLLEDSSIEISFYKDLMGFEGSVNVVRFYKSNLTSIGENVEFLVCGISDKKVIIFLGNKKCSHQFEIYHISDDSCTDIQWIGKDHIVVSFSSGNIILFKLTYTNNCNGELTEINKYEKDIKHCHIKSTISSTVKAHSERIRGIVYNNHHSCILTHAQDKTSKLLLIKKNNLIEISTFTKNIDNSVGYYKRCEIDEDFLYIISKQKYLNLYCYPFKEVHLSKSIGPFSSSLVKIIRTDNFIIVICYKAIYIFDRNFKKKYFIENASYAPINDAIFHKNVLYYCAEDGLIYTIRIKVNNFKNFIIRLPKRVICN